MVPSVYRIGTDKNVCHHLKYPEVTRKGSNHGGVIENVHADKKCTPFLSAWQKIWRFFSLKISVRAAVLVLQPSSTKRGKGWSRFKCLIPGGGMDGRENGRGVCGRGERVWGGGGGDCWINHARHFRDTIKDGISSTFSFFFFSCRWFHGFEIHTSK